MKSARLTSLKTYSTVVAAQRNALVRPLALVKNVNVSLKKTIAIKSRLK